MVKKNYDKKIDIRGKFTLPFISVQIYLPTKAKPTKYILLYIKNFSPTNFFQSFINLEGSRVHSYILD